MKRRGWKGEREREEERAKGGERWNRENEREEEIKEKSRQKVKEASCVCPASEGTSRLSA